MRLFYRRLTRLHMCAHMPISIFTKHMYRAHTRIKQTHSYIHTYLHTYIHTYIHMYIHTYKHAYMHTYKSYKHTYTPTNIHTCIHTYMHTCIHAHIRSKSETESFKPPQQEIINAKR